MTKRTSRFLPLAALLLSSSLRAAVVEPLSLAPALGMVASVPALRASVLSQISVVSWLNAQPVATLSPILFASPTATDPWRGEAARFVGALVGDSRVADVHQEALRAAFGDKAAESLRKAAMGMQARAASDSALQAQLDQLRSGFNFHDPRDVKELAARLNAVFENSKTSSEGASGDAVAGADSEQKKLPDSLKLQRSTGPTQKR
jgi:hypothetical protein